MINIYSNFSLKAFNSFGFDILAERYITVDSSDDLQKVRKELSSPCLVLGGGSNILFTANFAGTILHPLIQGVELEETQDRVYLRVGAGMVWDDLVAYTVANNWGGLENLSLIPGRVGASPVQNIGAYGVEAKDTIVKVEGLFLENMQSFVFDNKTCEFAYRDSIFKNALKDKTVITHVTFCLRKQPEYILNYGNVEQELEKYKEVNLQNIRAAIISIRESKLPDPLKLGNVGSFFKNPIVESSFADELKKKYDNLPIYSLTNNKVKLAAGWLIDQAGMKGYRHGEVGVHDKQALVLVNYASNNPKDIINLANEVIDKVYSKFQVRLEPEVNYI